MTETYVRAVFEDAKGDVRSVEIRYDTVDATMPVAEYVRRVIDLVPDTALIRKIVVDGDDRIGGGA